MALEVGMLEQHRFPHELAKQFTPRPVHLVIDFVDNVQAIILKPVGRQNQ